MYRILAFLVLLTAVSLTATADEVKGVVKKVDPQKSTITLTVDGKDRLMKVNKDASFVTVTTVAAKKKKQNMEQLTTIETGLAGVSSGANVTLLTESQDGKDFVTSVKVSGGMAAAKQKQKKKKKN